MIFLKLLPAEHNITLNSWLNKEVYLSSFARICAEHKDKTIFVEVEKQMAIWKKKLE